MQFYLNMLFLLREFRCSWLSVSELLSTQVNESPSLLFMLQLNTKTLFELQDGTGGIRKGPETAILQKLQFYSVSIIPFLLHIQSSIIQWLNNSSVWDCSFEDVASSYPTSQRNFNNRQPRWPECSVTPHNKPTPVKQWYPQMHTNILMLFIYTMNCYMFRPIVWASSGM
jgi:hypothetical protein